MENFCECHCLNVVVSINSFSALDVTVNTNLKYDQTSSKKLKLIEWAMKFFLGRVTGA